MVAPINCLPPEILSRIFVILAQYSRYAASIGDKSYNEVDYPLRLSSICVRWRQVAIGTPSLWSFLDLCKPEYSSEDFRYLNVCYERSGNTPLTLRLGKYDDECDLDNVDEQLEPLLSLCATRLESLVVAYHAPGFAKQVLSVLLARGAAGRVRKLALHANWEDDLVLADSSLSQRILDELFEPLQSLYLECVAFDWSTMRCRNLVELQLSRLDTSARPSSSQLASLLSANPNIHKLQISGFELSPYDSTLPQIKLSQLQNLELEMDPELTQWLFTLLTPGTRDISLQIYSYATESHNAQVVIETLCQFFRRSKIVALRMMGSRFVPFSSVAAYLPHLEILRVDGPGGGYDLSCIEPQAELLLKLHTIELIYCTTRDVESGIGTVLSLHSVSQILFPTFDSVDETGKTTSMDIDEVREWMHGRGVTANVRMAPELLLNRNPTPFM
ncbi:hypothetical protein BDV93DRAFT_362368 [Ceratobasidium sp. AG-I]|nr:hypothetical protein BDV93DRAFT_362368 [Ceratobasidium sp. AG-I]